jgi:DNA adenine methylase
MEMINYLARRKPAKNLLFSGNLVLDLDFKDSETNESNGQLLNGTQPFLKWAGGKRQLLPYLAKHLPASYGSYIEPFLGGGAMFFYLKPQRAILADLNEDLINCFTIVRDNVEPLIKALNKYVNDEDFYYRIREQDPKSLSDIERAARTIYLNKTCYNGLYRVNKKGDFNVPFGRREKPSICEPKVLFAAHQALQGAQLIHGDYQQVLKRYAKPGDFIYLDPPYYPAEGYADFKRYTKEFFYEEDHIELRNEVRRLVDRGCWVLLTNSNTEFVRNLYEGFSYEVLDARRSISCNPETRVGQDLIVIATKPAVKTPALIKLHSEQLLENFPGTRYMGSKYRVLPFIWECVKDLKFSSVLDAFAGSGCVAYMFKQRGKRVIANDFLKFSFYFSQALIENSHVILTPAERDFLVQPNPDAGTFIADTFDGLYFAHDENRFLDSLRANIEQLDNSYKKSLALAAMVRACLKRRPRGIFTFVGDRYNDGRRDMQLSLREHFIENIAAFNRAVFDNKQKNQAYGLDIFDLDIEADLVYFDPPYFTLNADNDYTRRYHFVEGLVRQWQGLEIQYHTATRKFKSYETPFSKKETAGDAFDMLFKKFKNSIIVVSYSSNSLPDKGTLVSLLKKYKRRVQVHQVEHLYSFGNQNHKVGNNANRVNEFVFVAF